MMLLKCSQYVTKFGNLSSGHRTGKDQFPFQSERKTGLKNVQTTVCFLLISHVNKIMLKILLANHQQYVNWEFLAWKIPWTEEPCGLPSRGSHRIRHDWSDLAAVAGVQAVSERQWKQRSNLKHSLNHRESKGIPEKHLLHWWKPLTVWITTNCGTF